MKKLLLLSLILLFLANNGNAQQAFFNSQPLILTTGSDAKFVGTGDINGDGINDLVGCTGTYFDSLDDQRIFLWLGNTSGIAAQPTKLKYSNNYVAEGMAVYDLDNDGKSEIILGIGNCFYIYSWSNNALTFKDSIVLKNFRGAGNITIGDFDGNDRVDIAASLIADSRICIAYQTDSTWDVRDYQIPVAAFGDLICGELDSPTHTTLINVIASGPSPVILMNFDKDRNMLSRRDLKTNGYVYVHSAAIVKKRPGRNYQLWVSCGGNRPDSKVLIWHTFQGLPDSILDVYDIPEAIRADNLDCDADDEAVTLHGGWQQASVFTNTIDAYPVFTEDHFSPQGLALGDVNNDGRKDICIANGLTPGGIWILYNATLPCWPTAVSQPPFPVSGIQAYPNPVVDELHITINNALDSDAIFQVLNINGKVIYQQKVTHQNTVLNTSQWPNGLNFIRYIDNNFRQTIKVVK